MSVGPLGIASSVSASVQSRGSDPERNQLEVGVQERRVESEQHAESAAGVGETAEDSRSSERDADGRRLWEKQEPRGDRDAEEASVPRSRDASGERGTNLDLTG